jgi:hypothetical protein
VLSTHRSRTLGPDAAAYFQFEPAIAAISVGFFRTTVGISKTEPIWLRWIFAAILAVLAYQKRPYEIIFAVEIFSYAVPYVLFPTPPPAQSSSDAKHGNGAKTEDDMKSEQSTNGWLSRAPAILAYLTGSAAVSLLVAHWAASGHISQLLRFVTPTFLVRFLKYMFPIEELVQAYRIMSRFAHPVVLKKQVSHLLFVTFHIQVGMGYLGIDFLRQEQGRRNELVRMDVAPTRQEEASAAQEQHNNDGASSSGTARSTSNGISKATGKQGTANKRTTEKMVETVRLDRARRFQRTAPAFILWTALPYMFQIILYGNVNKFAFTCVQHDLHRAVRLNELFDHDNRLMSMAADSATSPEGTL